MKHTIFKIPVRVILVSLYAIVVVVFVKHNMQNDAVSSPLLPIWVFLLIYLTFFNLNTEGNLFFDRYLNSKLPWFYFPRKRLLVQFGFILGWSFISLATPFMILRFIRGSSLLYPSFSGFVLLSAIVLLIVFIGINITINFFQQWKKTLLEMEHLKQEKLKSDYKVLQNQLNPHFLFNSLNVLISEIKHNPDTAEVFTRKLSNVYRYVLQSKNHDLIALKKELNFIDSYIYLHEIRSGDALKVKIDVKDEILHQNIPPLTLQILVENAIKHNVMNKENPLYITIETPDSKTLIVKNNLNPKQSLDSTKIGLSNIKARYELLKEDGFNIEKSTTEYIVTVALLDE